MAVVMYATLFYWLDVTLLTPECGGGINDQGLLGESSKPILVMVQKI